jgi:hypothetical protein
MSKKEQKATTESTFSPEEKVLIASLEGSLPVTRGFVFQTVRGLLSATSLYDRGLPFKMQYRDAVTAAQTGHARPAEIPEELWKSWDESTKIKFGTKIKVGVPVPAELAEMSENLKGAYRDVIQSIKEMQGLMNLNVGSGVRGTGKGGIKTPRDTPNKIPEKVLRQWEPQIIAAGGTVDYDQGVVNFPGHAPQTYMTNVKRNFLFKKQKEVKVETQQT